MTLYVLTERYTGERDVYVNADSKQEALELAREGNYWDLGEPSQFDYRYVGPVREADDQERPPEGADPR